ncbi:MAG: hypothetical protein EOP19_12000 [Hyphomicrobiales bacterium]|nr:MAG: hypothetical protein EOP19_12000 [Hyphomicrobiales bacterium]
MLEATTPRRRAPRDEIVHKRQALELLVPIHQQIGPWQTRTARLLAYAERLRSTGSYEPALVAEAEALFTAVTTQQQRLIDTQRDLPAALAANSRFLDTARALKSVAAGLESALSLMQRGQRPMA